MPGKLVLLGEEAREAIKEGVDVLSNAVRVTMGPKGRHVMIEKRFSSPLVTHDGYTVANVVDNLENPFVNTGAQIAYQATKETNTSAGDGTSTAAILTQAIYSEGLRVVTAGMNAMILRPGMEKACKAVIEHLKASATEIEDDEQLRFVAAVSAADKELGATIAGVLSKVGKEGGVNLEDGQTSEVEIEIVSGLTFDRGYVSPYFGGADGATEASLEKPHILLTDQKLSAAADILPLLEKFVEAGHQNLLVVAEDIEGEALGLLVLNRLKGTLNVSAVKAPAFGDRRRWMLDDYAIFTGGKLVAKELGVSWDQIDLSYLGRADSVTVRKDETVIVNGHGDLEEIKRRIASVWETHERAKNDYDREKLSERANNLAGSVGVIRVGAPTEVEQKELKHRVEDAVAASRAALEEGFITGGGVALIRAEGAIDELNLTGDELVGATIVRKALAQPLMQIASNAGHDSEVIASKVREKEGTVGFNVMTDEYEDLVKAGVIDPVKVTRLAISNAVSAAIMLLTTEALIVDAPAKK
jgi:chaperonin GroEL